MGFVLALKEERIVNVYMILIFCAEVEEPERGTGNVIKEET